MAITYSIIADMHTHTLACDHAYSTVGENAEAASEMGLAAIIMTEHTSSLPGAPLPLHFANLTQIPRELSGVAIIKGAEVNIIDYNGAVDLLESVMKRLEWIIASMHTPCIKSGTREDHTKAWLKVAENPLVDVLGHMGDARYAFDHEAVLKRVKETGKIVEINAHSFGARPGSATNCKDIAVRCKALGIPVAVSSDAHHSSQIGEFTAAIQMLVDVDFPESLVINADKDRFFAEVEARTALKRL